MFRRQVGLAAARHALRSGSHSQGAGLVTESPLSPTLQRLLFDHLTSFEQLEIILLLREHPSRDWSVTMLSETLRTPPDLVETALARLEASQLARGSADGATFRFAPATPAIEKSVDELAEAYRQQRAALLSTMSVNAIARIRSGPMRTFADAFIVRKRKDHG
jgi:hypothetical protein